LQKRIRKAVIPAAGLGTRFLPATKAVQKEMIPLVARPLIQFAVEEAAAAGIDTVVLITNADKSLVTGYFSRDLALEQILLQRGKDEEAALVRDLSDLAEIQTVCQKVPLGLGDAVRMAQAAIGKEPFAVILPDALIDSQVPCIGQLMGCYEEHRGCIVATQTVDPSEVDRFGILDVVSLPRPCCDDRTLLVRSLIERPKLGSVPFRHGIFGRYILEPEIFSCIERTRPGFAGEIQLTDALELYAATCPLYCYHFEGNHYDAGSKLGFLKATIAYALKDPEIGSSLREHLIALGLTQETTVG
jgi:UTP--glucose-1-phosphate uridylyltransferase